MQTLLPYPDYAESAACLDWRRLGKMRPECKQILMALAGQSKGWVNHSVTRMWRGHEYALYCYGRAVCDEWVARGYTDNCAENMRRLVESAAFRDSRGYIGGDNPPWLGDPALHAAYRSNLIRKGIEDVTFARHKGEDGLPARKALWTPEHYADAWARYGKPDRAETHYGQFGWQEPDDLPYVWPA